MFDDRELWSNLYFYPQLFGDLAMEALDERLTWLALAARKFPQSAEHFVFWPAGDQDAAISALDDSSRHLMMWYRLAGGLHRAVFLDALQLRQTIPIQWARLARRAFRTAHPAAQFHQALIPLASFPHVDKLPGDPPQ